MARHYRIVVKFHEKRADVVVGSIPQATGLAAMNLQAGREVFCTPTKDEITHKNTHHAQAVIDLRLIDMEIGDVVPVQARMTL